MIPIFIASKILSLIFLVEVPPIEMVLIHVIGSLVITDGFID
jgi:hypothetical protein